jgi:tRNA CCA-adding enzyme
MAQNINSILKEVLEKIKPSKEEFQNIKKLVEEFSIKLEKRVKKLNLDAEAFIGGSFAKNSMIKKDHYDVDVFLRFDKKYEDEKISRLAEEILKVFENVSLVHGSRDYFKIKLAPLIYIELVPVRKIKNPKEAENITDLSYSHVKYINKKVRSEKVLDEIRLAKAFCYANQCYGAESYINGFSGYALELLAYYYGSFLKFIKTMEKIDKKLVIDIEKHHKSKENVMMDLNASKLHSPIILIDPTYKQRNALAALSEETFEKFKKSCREFIKHPTIEAFEVKKTDLEKIKKQAKKNNYEFILIETNTNKQPGDIAGSKLLKFHRHLEKELKLCFEIKNTGFNYNKEKSARYFFVVKSKGDKILQGPSLADKENAIKFRKKHKSIFTRSKKIYAREKIKSNIKDFFEDWKKKNKARISQMYITKLEIIE